MLGKNRWMLVLFGIILAGFFLRAYDISGESIWLDEAFSLHITNQDFMDVITLEDPSPPLFHIILYFWIRVFGASLESARFLSVTIGTILIYMIYVLGKELFSRKTGIIASAILAASPLHIYLSQEARTYALLSLLSIVSMHFYFRITKRISIKDAVFYILVSSLMLYSHFYALFLILAQNIHVLIRNKGRLNPYLIRWGVIQSILLITFIPWIISLFSVIPQGLHSWITMPSAYELFAFTYHSFSGIVFSIPGIILALFCLALLVSYRHDSRKKSFFIIWMLVPVLLPFLYSLISTPIFIPKYAYFVSLPMYILIADRLSQIKGAKHISAFLGIIMVLSLAALYIQHDAGSKDAWDEVSAHITEYYQEGDNIIILSSYEILPFSYYFDNDCFIAEDVYYCSRKKGIYPVDTYSQIKGIEGKRIWLILSREKNNEDAGKILNYLDSIYENSSYKAFDSYNHMISVYLYY